MAKILIVDDERVLVKGIKFNLEHEGYQVEVGYDGEQAVELARNGYQMQYVFGAISSDIATLQAVIRG